MHRDGASEAVEAAQSQARPSHGRSEQIASNCSKHVVGVGSNGETKGRKRSQRDGQNLQRFSTLGEVSRAYLGRGARGAPPARGIARTERSFARYALVPNRDTPTAAVLWNEVVRVRTVSFVVLVNVRTLCAGNPRAVKRRQCTAVVCYQL